MKYFLSSVRVALDCRFHAEAGALEFILAAEAILANLIEMNIEGAPHPKMLEYLKLKHEAQEEYVEQ